MKRLILTLFLSIVTIGFAQAQKVKFKKGIVYVDGKKCLLYDGSDPNNVVITDLEDSQTIFLKYIWQEGDEMYTKVTFAEQKKSFTTRSYIFTKKILVKKLIKSKVIKDCTFDESKIDKFIMRYDEDIKEPEVIIIEHRG